MKTNILCQYQGGGYDGCIWEWNFFYIDKAGTFHNIQSSGCSGIDNMQDAIELIKQDESGTYIYDLSNEQDIKTFSKESHAAHVSGVLRWFEHHNDSEIEFFAVCSACQSHFIDADDLVIEGSDILCNECYSIGSCPCCESYVGDDELEPVNPDEHNGHDYICACCKEYHDDDREQEQIEDLRWQSFCTGSPDMFDLESAEPEVDSRIEYAGQRVFNY